MRKQFSEEVERRREGGGHFATPRGARCGVFYLRCQATGGKLTVVISNAADAVQAGLPPWNHVSVNAHGRTPTWEEMCWVKDLFFEEEECVMQFHPPKSKYINKHPNVLHLWHQEGVTFKLPDPRMI